ncbi:hypothetical protein FE257_004202 [Aspergillus nanangensis]|uniref:F-box domain-containing protein n=1 Tax=Aspergillus nanangensis TaxID=2582783 RepID=A0AAD4CTA5_ASPNN|nr:hypothetical protein FE257_004202 [Aspergillus nanangensis]
MLTPIHVRGRRKKPLPAAQKHNDAPSAASTAAPAPAPASRKRKPGRPLMSPDELRHSSQSRSIKRVRIITKQSKSLRQKGRRHLSNLERLPVELIEKIFLYSLNVNLPRCSNVLAAAVSSERIYRALILLAFWDDSCALITTAEGIDNDDDARQQKSSAVAAIKRILRPLDYTPLTVDQRKTLQTALVRCHWCTFPRILKSLPDLMALTIQRHWISAGIIMTPIDEERLSQFLSREETATTEDLPHPSFEGTITPAKDPLTPHTYTMTITPPTSIHIVSTLHAHTHTHPTFSPLLFPDSLLRGRTGFPTPHIIFLETLRVASGLNSPDLISPTISLRHDALHEGIHMALIEENHRALATLLKLDEYVFRAEITSVTTDANSVPYTLPAEHFRTAVRVARDDPACFQMLVRASAESVPDDAEVTQWAMELDDAFGHWLLDLMVRLPRQIEAANGNPAEAAVFYLGRANTQVELARRYVSDVLGVEELGSWMEETVVDLGEVWRGRGDWDPIG